MREVDWDEVDSPRVLDLPAAEELTAIEHRGLLEVNGFGISIDEEALVGQRVKLIAQPVSKSTVWGISGSSPSLFHTHPHRETPRSDRSVEIY